ncbi:MAG TPA: hypothetical protein VH478_09240 [Trebonia sp.]|nr:hypothetical protein [Trebonia sp.]
MASSPSPVYSKSNPAAATPMPPGQKRLLLVAGAVILAAAIGGGIWAGLSPDSQARSANGCISLNVPGSMGGQFIHECGGQARATCRAAWAGSDAIARAEQAACAQAGLARDAADG